MAYKPTKTHYGIGIVILLAILAFVGYKYWGWFGGTKSDGTSRRFRVGGIGSPGSGVVGGGGGVSVGSGSIGGIGSGSVGTIGGGVDPGHGIIVPRPPYTTNVFPCTTGYGAPGTIINGHCVPNPVYAPKVPDDCWPTWGKDPAGGFGGQVQTGWCCTATVGGKSSTKCSEFASGTKKEDALNALKASMSH